VVGLSPILIAISSITTPSQHHHNTITTPSQHHHNTITTPSQHHHNTITTPSQHYYDTGVLTLVVGPFSISTAISRQSSSGVVMVL
jgi:hypothetical protein